MFIAALVTITKTWKPPKHLSIYLYTKEYYSAIKKNKILSFAATWMDLGIIILSEISQRNTNI